MTERNGKELRQKHAETTRDHLVDAAYDLLLHADQTFSHEAIAALAGVGARTVYRYFPAQADLYEALWVRMRRQAGTIFPSLEEQILPQITTLFGGFNRNEKVIRAALESPAGHRVRERGAPEGRAAFSKSLAALTVGMSPVQKRQVVAVFLAIYSAPFWELLRNRGGLSGPDAIAAAEWAMSTLIEGLRRNRPASKDKRRRKNTTRSSSLNQRCSRTLFLSARNQSQGNRP